MLGQPFCLRVLSWPITFFEKLHATMLPHLLTDNFTGP